MKSMEQAEEYLAGQDGVASLATFGGGGQVRFLLTYSPEARMANFAQILVSVDDYKKIPGMIRPVQESMSAMFPEASVNTKLFVNGPSVGGKIQLRIYGPESDTLRSLMGTAKKVVLDHPNSQAVRDEWENQIKVLRPQMAETRASRVGITRPMLASALESGLEGTAVGVYREGDDLLPIIARSPERERLDFDSLGGIPVWSPAAGRSIPMGQVVNGFEVEFEDPVIGRRNRRKMIRLHTDPKEGLPSLLFADLKPAIEKALNVDVAAVTGRRFAEGQDPFKGHDAGTIPVSNNALLPLKGMPGYYMSWGGEAEDSARSSASLAGKLPIFFGLMILIVLALFNSIKKTLIIWLCVPLAIIGVTAGLLLLRQPFGFMSLLGLLSLSGMLIKNAIVLIDQIGLEIEGGKSPYQAIVDSGVSRLIPVSMAALTTILGMLPLVQDAFFISMAVTIMFGLAFATVLTLMVVPVLYAIFYKVPSPVR
jgi:multidrug efflux pump subunit AcrB